MTTCLKYTNKCNTGILVGQFLLRFCRSVNHALRHFAYSTVLLTLIAVSPATVFYLGLATSVEAAPLYVVSERLVGFNTTGPSVSSGADIVPEAFDFSTDGTTVLSSMNGQYSTSGMDTGGDQSTLTLAYDGMAQVSAGGEIKSKLFGSLDGAFFNPSNDPFVLDTDFNTDPDGVPQDISFSSEAFFSDTLNIQGSNNLSSIVISLNLDGMSTTLNEFPFPFDPSVSVALTQQENFFGPSSLLFSEFLPGTFDETILSAPIPVVNGMADFGTQLFLEIYFNLVPFGDPGFDDPLNVPTIGGTIDFFNTLTIGEIAGFDVNGNPVDLVSATDSTGFQFTTVRVNTNNVPEPETLALFFIGLAGFGFMSYRRPNYKQARIGPISLA